MENTLEKYADLAVRIGVNIQQGQILYLSAPVTSAAFARKIVKKAYEAGAKNVIIDWVDDEITLLKMQLAPIEGLKEYPSYLADVRIKAAKEGAAFLNVVSSNPALLSQVEPDRVAAAVKARRTALKEYFDDFIMTSRASWSIIAVPSVEWAQKVFPHASEEEAMEKLWNLIFQATRMDQEDPVQAWKEHEKRLVEKVTYLNEKRFKKLHYTSPGTNLTIELPEDHVWIGAGDTTPDGIKTMPNIPTEEVFTMPHRDKVNGTVSSTKPLNYNGSLIDGFSLTFENGRIIDYSAEKGYEILKNLIESDEGSHYLGEIALVPHDSPISNMNVLFYNTLFDENASCHLAIGGAYPTNLKNSVDMNQAQLEEKGVNFSLTHEDFMIGSAELHIDGETLDGEKITLFHDGNWAV